jgi:hypothetical protein
MLSEGGAYVDLKWSDLDVDHKLEASERIMGELIVMPDYRWLASFVTNHLHDKYCKECLYNLDMKGCNRENNPPQFPYCFKEK